jgi:hypothetical protein
MPSGEVSTGIHAPEWWEAGRVGCLITKVLIPMVERDVGPDGAAALLRLAGHPRDYLLTTWSVWRCV